MGPRLVGDKACWGQGLLGPRLVSARGPRAAAIVHVGLEFVFSLHSDGFKVQLRPAMGNRPDLHTFGAKIFSSRICEVICSLPVTSRKA